jgi:hypothetical protein
VVAQIMNMIYASDNAGALAAIVVKDGILNGDICAVAHVKAIATRIIAGNSVDGDIAGISDIQAMPLLAARVFRLAHMEHRNRSARSSDRDVRGTDVEHSHAIAITRIGGHGNPGVHEYVGVRGKRNWIDVVATRRYLEGLAIRRGVVQCRLKDIRVITAKAGVSKMQQTYSIGRSGIGRRGCR